LLAQQLGVIPATRKVHLFAYFNNLPTCNLRCGLRLHRMGTQRSLARALIRQGIEPFG
jgi:hypothetical protein